MRSPQAGSVGVQLARELIGLASMRIPRALLSLLVATLFAAPAAAQPGASWTESGDVSIQMIGPGPTFYGRDAEDVLESDVVHEITVGDSGLIEDQQSGTLRIEGVGDQVTPRHLGDVFVLVGTLELSDVFVDADFMRIGVSVESQFTDLSEGTLSVLLSELSNEVTIRNGFFGCQASRIGGVTVLALGRAQISGCVIEAISISNPGTVSIDASTVDASSPSFRGNTVVTNSTILGNTGGALDGVIEIGQPGEPVSWDAAGTITVGANAVATDLTVTDSTLDSNEAYVRGGGLTDFEMRGAALWRTAGLFRFSSPSVTADINSASRIEVGTNLWLVGAQVTVRSGVGVDSRIEVAGDFGLGNVDEDTFGTGTLTIEDGGYVGVDGTFTIRPLATLNLNGGTLRVTAFDNQGTFNENGGTLIVPEPATPAVAAWLALALVARCARRRSSLANGA
jgi:hypothetical protein